MRTRRSILGLGAGALLAAALPLPAMAAGESWVVSFLWSRTLARVLAHRKVVAQALGPEIGARLLVVSGSPAPWGLIDEQASTEQASVQKLAQQCHEKLRAALGGSDLLATPMPNRGYALTHHVGYGVLASEKEALARHALLSKLLGPEVQSALSLEEVGPGQWQSLYKRFGDEATTTTVAGAHSKLLAKHGVKATLVPDRYYDPRWATLAPPLAAEVKATEVKATEVKTAEVAEPVPQPPPLEATKKSPPAQAQDPLDLPATSSTSLREAINQYVQDLRRKGVIDDDETTSWYVQTLHDDRTWAAINAERSLQCASMVKPYVALAFLHRAEEGRIVYGDMSRAKLEAMIQYSSNSATNWAMTTLGGPAAVQRILTQHYGHLLRETSIIETIPKSGRTYRNRSSARDYVRFSRALWRAELPHSTELKRLMSLPGRDRLYTGAPAIPKCTQVMNKTGTTAQLCGDFGILVAQTRSGEKVPYAIVGIIEKSCPAQGYSSWVASRTQVIRGVSNLTYEALKEHYRLV
jgi:beta-lactamase class A